MDHWTDERLLPYLDDELKPDERAEIERHLAGCAECRATLAALRAASERLSEALQIVDRPAPRIESPAAIAASPVRRRRRAWSVPAAWVRVAALVIVAAGVAAAAVPGSPVRDWVARTFGLVASREGDEGDAAQADRGATAADPSGVAVPLADGSIRVHLTRPSPDAIVRVRLVDGEQGAVRAPDARYRTGPGRIEVLAAGPGELRIDIPRSAREGRVELDGRLVVWKEATVLRLITPIADSVGAELVFRAGRDTAAP